jgi:hypothetical protein
VGQVGFADHFAVEQGAQIFIAAEQGGSLVFQHDFAVLGGDFWQGDADIAAAISADGGAAFSEGEDSIGDAS